MRSKISLPSNEQISYGRQGLRLPSWSSFWPFSSVFQPIDGPFAGHFLFANYPTRDPQLLRPLSSTPTRLRPLDPPTASPRPSYCVPSLQLQPDCVPSTLLLLCPLYSQTDPTACLLFNSDKTVSPRPSYCIPSLLLSGTR